jgi:hypothetical protein
MKIIKTTIVFVILFSLSSSLQAQINMKGITKKVTKEVKNSSSETMDKNNNSNTTQSQENTTQSDKEKQQNDKMSERRNASQNKSKVENYFHEMFELKAMSFNVSELPGVEAKINAFKEKGEELLAIEFGTRDRQNKDIKRFFTHIDYYAFNTNKRLDQIEAVRAKSGYNDKDAIAQAYWEMQYFNVFWDIVHKLFPQETEYSRMLEKSNDVSKKNGSIAQIKSSTANSKVEENKNRRLPVAVASDPALEKLSIETFNKYLSSELKGTANKAIMMQKDWSTYRADITGAILGRKIQVAIAYKGTDGKCYVATGIILKQDYIGGAFKNTSAADARLSGGELPCEFAK